MMRWRRAGLGLREVLRPSQRACRRRLAKLIISAVRRRPALLEDRRSAAPLWTGVRTTPDPPHADICSGRHNSSTTCRHVVGTYLGVIFARAL